MNRKPYDFQYLGRDFLASKRIAYLADDMGLGKTYQIIMAARQLPSAAVERTLIFTSAIGRSVWRREMDGEIPIKPFIITKSKQLPAAVNSAIGIIVISYPMAIRGDNLFMLMSWCPTLVIFDEAQALRRLETTTTKAMLGFGKYPGFVNPPHYPAPVVWFASGTPVKADYVELYPYLATAIPDVLVANGIASFDAFRDYFCVTIKFTQYTAKGPIILPKIIENRNHEYLRWLCKDTVLRRLKSEVLKELPPIIKQDFIVSIDENPFLIEQLNIANELQFFQQEFEERSRTGKFPKAFLDMMTSNRMALADIKVPSVVEFCKSFADQTPDKHAKGIIFGWHRAPLERLYEELKPIIGKDRIHIINGSTPDHEKIRIEDKFQNGPGPQFLVGNIIAAGTAITLTAATLVGFLERNWTPADNSQARDRAYRIGQSMPLHEVDFVADHPFDKRLYEVLHRRETEIDQIWGIGS